MLQSFWLPPVGSGNSIKHIISMLVSDALPILVQVINPVLLGSPCSIRIQRADWHQDMKMRVLDSFPFRIVHTKIYYHSVSHKTLEKKRFCNLQIFLKGQFILQGNIKGIRQLSIVSAFNFFYLIPECLPI